MKLDSVFSGLNISAMGLSAQRKRMNAIASNLANAETSKTEKGVPYRRKIVEMTAKNAQAFSTVMQDAGLKLSTTSEGHLQQGPMGFTESQEVAGGVDSREVEDTAPPKVVYDPDNPEADPNGYVTMPNVNVVTEMVNMISASRSFEANVQAVNAAKTMAKDSLEI
jgi:flagellar basal-body rod protein FlgC